MHLAKSPHNEIRLIPKSTQLKSDFGSLPRVRPITALTLSLKAASVNSGRPVGPRALSNAFPTSHNSHTHGNINFHGNIQHRPRSETDTWSNEATHTVILLFTETYSTALEARPTQGPTRRRLASTRRRRPTPRGPPKRRDPATPRSRRRA